MCEFMSLVFSLFVMRVKGYGVVWGCIIWWLGVFAFLFSRGFFIRGSCECGFRSYFYEMKYMMIIGRRGRVNIFKEEWI